MSGDNGAGGGEFWKGRRVLVTGAGGFIGSHLTELLAREGAEVRAFVQYNCRNDWGWVETLDADLRERLEVFPGDICSADDAARATKGREVVFHLAALISIPYSYLSPDAYVSVNVGGTLNLLRAARAEGVRRFVHTSTSEVYGSARYVPMDEAHPLNPQSPYAASKASADMLALSFWASYDLPVAVIRPFNAFGPRQSTRAIIPSLLCQALARDVVEVGALEPRRDFTYVKDTAEGFLRMAEAEGVLGEVVNVGSGRDVSIGELVEIVRRVTGEDFRLVVRSERLRPPKSEVDRLLCDRGKAERLLGWKPRRALEEGVAELAAWLAERLPEHKPGTLAL